ncbi:hypothetical protein NC651_022555 [Populus alba x Populus x berolinensis]|nr:hypothetical protein NC651_022555 [Populus alba x Populus x berolinensis]
MDKVSESMVRSYGVLTNSFLELEPAYSEHYKMSLNSVLYICFGSFFNLSAAQLLEFAMALEASGQNFIWVVRRESKQSLQKRRSGCQKDLRKGWKKAVGGFMTHCGWNSTLEGVTAGVPMVTWPLGVKYNHNERLIVEVLKIRVAVGAQEWSRHEREILVKREEIEMAIIQLLVGEEAEELRNRAQALREMAMKILNLRSSIWGHLMHRIGSGKKAYLWWDNWLPSGPLVENSGTRIIQQSSLRSHMRW